MSPRAAGAPATRSVIVYQQGGAKTRVANIPANAKITFGPVSPGARDFSGRDGNALRIYTSQSNQLAVFVNVVSFRDESLTVQTQKVIKTSAEEAQQGAKGSKRSVESEVVYEWENDK